MTFSWYMCTLCCTEVKHSEKQQTVKHVKVLSAFIYYISICKHTHPTVKNRTKVQWDNNHKKSDQTEINTPRFTLHKTYSEEKAHLDITWSGHQLRKGRNKMPNNWALETGKAIRPKRDTLETKAESVTLLHLSQISDTSGSIFLFVLSMD